MAHDVFISYSSKDKTIAEVVCTTLEINGIKCWVAPRDIIPGNSWGMSIAQAIAQSRAMVLIFSANANRSEHIVREVERAASKSLTIIPFRIEDVTPSISLEYFLSTLHWLDALTPPLDKHSQRLVHHLHSLLGMSPERVREKEADDSAQHSTDSERTAQKVTEREWWAPLVSAPNKVERKRMVLHALGGGLSIAVLGLIIFLIIAIPVYNNPTAITPYLDPGSTLPDHIDDKFRMEVLLALFLYIVIGGGLAGALLGIITGPAIRTLIQYVWRD